MTNGELKKYLNMFPDNVNVSLILANPRERKKYDVVEVIYITDMNQPVFCVDIGQAQNMDEEEINACEEDEREAEQLEGQINIADFPEVMP